LYSGEPDNLADIRRSAHIAASWEAFSDNRFEQTDSGDDRPENGLSRRQSRRAGPSRREHIRVAGRVRRNNGALRVRKVDTASHSWGPADADWRPGYGGRRRPDIHERRPANRN